MTTNRIPCTVALLALACGCRPAGPVDVPAEPSATVPPAPIIAETGEPDIEPLGTPTRIAFGSCHDTKKKPMWSAVLATHPDVWVWLGDNVYADTEDMTQMWATYQELLAQPGYRELMRSTRVVGTWDDHDYGANDAGNEYPMRAESQQLFLDFIGEPRDTPRRKQEGVYAAYRVGSPDRRVQIIVLDTRYHRDAPGTPNGDVLGEAQWAWLERTLSEPARLRLVASSIQVVSEKHPHEKWANFPEARKRLFATIAKAGAHGVLFLSGDRHLAEISRLEESVVGYPLYDVTSSSMGRPHLAPPEYENRYRVGELYWKTNFGIIDVYWDREPPLVRIEIRDADGRTQLEHEVSLAELAPNP